LVKMLAHRREILNGSGGSFRPAANHCGSSHITAWSALIRGSPATTFTLMLMIFIMLAILTLIFSAGLPPSIALILSVSVISGAAVTYWFSRTRKNTRPVGIVAEQDTNPEFRNKAS